MRKHLVLVFSLFLLSSLGQATYALAANQPIMTLEEVERLIDSSPNKEVGAYFMSTPRGTEPKRYNIVLRGVYKEPGLKVIMFVTSRHIAAGMSGSPAYINGKLIGAVAYSFNNFNFSSYAWGGISSISLMMEEAELGTQNQVTTRSFNYQGMSFKSIAVGDREIPGLESVSDGKFIVTTSSARTTTTKAAKPTLKAGMPIVVDLIEWTDEKGEVSTVSAMGTITYVGDDGKVFAFGHPFLDSHKVVYSFRTAEVMGTLDSENYSFKLRGENSEVLGAITFDAANGISGTTSLDNLSKLHNFTLEFKRKGESFHHFNIKVADSVITPLLAQAAFEMLGRSSGAPFPEEASVTQLETKVELKGHKPVVWKELFTSGIMKFGPSTIYTSSYKAAYEEFFSGIYNVLYRNQYGVEVSNVSVSANFIPGRGRVLKLSDYKFPNKIIWGKEDPVLQVLLVSQDGLLVIAKRVKVKIDWDKVEKPIYKKDTLETDKDRNKVVWGALKIESAPQFFNALTSSERQKFLPEYFLGVDDFLKNFAQQLEVTNQKIYTKVELRPRSGLFDDAVAQTGDIVPSGVADGDDSGWYVIEGGLTERKNTVRNEYAVTFYLNLPSAPNGYIIDQGMRANIAFEVVLEN